MDIETMTLLRHEGRRLSINSSEGDMASETTEQAFTPRQLPVRRGRWNVEVDTLQAMIHVTRLRCSPS